MRGIFAEFAVLTGIAAAPKKEMIKNLGQDKKMIGLTDELSKTTGNENLAKDVVAILINLDGDLDYPSTKELVRTS